MESITLPTMVASCSVTGWAICKCVNPGMIVCALAAACFCSTA